MTAIIDKVRSVRDSCRRNVMTEEVDANIREILGDAELASVFWSGLVLPVNVPHLETVS